MTSTYTVDYFQELHGQRMNAAALERLHTINPTEVQIVHEDDPIHADFRQGRLTVFVDDSGCITSTHSEVLA